MQYKTSLGNIHLWFPKSVYVADNLLLDDLLNLENSCKDIIENSGTIKNNMLSVNSTHKTNSDLYNRNEFKILKEEILKHSKNYLLEMGYNNEYLENLKFTNMWCNISKENDFIFPHVHSNSLLSGVFYIKSENANKIRFFKDPANMLAKPQEYNIFNYEYCDYECFPGRLLLFLSDLLHGNEKQEAEEKIAISFNLSCVNYGY